MGYIIACASVSAGTLQRSKNPSQVKTIPYMITRKKETIVIISSIGRVNKPSSVLLRTPQQSNGKSFWRSIKRDIYNITFIPQLLFLVIIKTSMTDVNNFPMPFILSVEKAAQKIIKGISNNEMSNDFSNYHFFFLNS